jgi:hypothetical protein
MAQYKCRFTRAPSSPSHMMSIHAISTVESMEVGTYHFTQGSLIPSPNYDMDADMVALCKGKAWDQCMGGFWA